MSDDREKIIKKEPFWNNIKVVPYLFILPNMILFLAFMILPLIMTGYYSLVKWNGIGKPKFIKLDNYLFIFKDSDFLTAIWNTVIFTVVTVPLMMAAAVFLAVLLNRKIHLRNFFRSAFYLPAIVSTVSIGMIFNWIFNSQLGLMNYLIELLHLHPIDWFNSGHYTMAMIILVTLWSRIGYNMVIYLASLQGISPEYYEAAMLDGATEWQKFCYITFPLLKPTNVFVLITCVIYAFRSFDLIYVMTKGGPLNATTTLAVYIYNEAFSMNNFGRASASGVVLFLILLVFTILQMKSNKENA